MTATPKMLIEPQDIPATQTTAYTSPVSGRGTWIDSGQVSNYGGGTETFSLWIVPAAGSASPSNQVQHDIGVAHKVSYPLQLGGVFIPAGSSLVWSASTASKLSGFVCGRELSA